MKSGFKIVAASIMLIVVLAVGVWFFAVKQLQTFSDKLGELETKLETRLEEDKKFAEAWRSDLHQKLASNTISESELSRLFRDNGSRAYRAQFCGDSNWKQKFKDKDLQQLQTDQFKSAALTAFERGWESMEKSIKDLDIKSEDICEKIK